MLIKIDVKDNNVEQAFESFKKKTTKGWFLQVIKLKNTYEKPSEKKKEYFKKI